MTFNIAPRESISRCDIYANKFQTHTDEIEARLKALRIQHANLDVHESESARLERQMMQRFTKGFILQEGSNFEFIKKVGKFIFVAVLLPPYFAVYLAPKWVFQYAMPFVADMGQTGFMRLYNLAVSATQWLAQISGQLLERFNKFFQFRLTFPFNIGKSSQDMVRRFFELIKSPFQLLLAPFSRLKQALQDEAKKQQKKLNSLWERVRQKLQQIKTHLTPSFSLTLPQLPRFPALPKLPKLTLPPLKDTARTLWGFIVPLKKIPIAFGLFLWDIVRLNYQNWIEPYIQWIPPFAQWIKAKADQLNLKVQTQLALIKNKADTIQAWLTSKLQAFSRKIAQFLTPFRLKVEKGRNLLKKAHLSFQNFVSSSKAMLLEKRSQVQAFLQQQQQKAKKQALNLLTALLQAPTKILHYLNHIADLLFAFLSELFKAFRLAFILLKVLLKLGFNYLRARF